MTTVKNILRRGIANTGSGFKITLSELVEKANMTETEVVIALNSITQWNAWNMIKN
tara:strand:+ start:3893 stop:4060 length:168 start_codon:yes stop_codon:yes gene_type:complete